MLLVMLVMPAMRMLVMLAGDDASDASDAILCVPKLCWVLLVAPLATDDYE